MSLLDVQLQHYGNSWHKNSSVDVQECYKKLLALNMMNYFAGDFYIVLILISYSAGWNIFFQTVFLLNCISLFLIETDIKIK